MRPIALDTNTYVGFKRGEAACVELIAQAPRLLISSTVLGELLAGFACGDREARNREELRRFLAVATVEVTSDRIGDRRHLWPALPRPATTGHADPQQRSVDCRQLPGAWSRAVQPGWPFRAGAWPAGGASLVGGVAMKATEPLYRGRGAPPGRGTPTTPSAVFWAYRLGCPRRVENARVGSRAAVASTLASKVSAA